MKKYLVIAIIISSCILLISLFVFFNLNVSLTYEIDEPKLMFKDRALEIEEKGKYLRELIFWFKCFLVYAFVNLTLFIVLLNKQKKLR